MDGCRVIRKCYFVLWWEKEMETQSMWCMSCVCGREIPENGGEGGRERV